MPNAVLEAMACGCLVIATRTGGCAELIAHGVHGLLANRADVEDLLVQMRIAVGDPARREQMAAAAALRARDEFPIAASARRLEKIYESYLSNSRGRWRTPISR
jgi:glycosyltransferase involved in cell wall biosynthesis